MNNSWKNISNKDSSFLTFKGAFKREHETFSILLEEVNKTWGRPYNWEVTLKGVDVLDKETFLDEQRFYLNKDNWSVESAQKYAEDFLSKYLESLV